MGKKVLVRIDGEKKWNWFMELESIIFWLNSKNRNEKVCILFRLLKFFFKI